MAPTEKPKAKVDGKAQRDEISIEESEAELASGDLFADESDGDEAIARVVDSIDEMILEEKVSEEAVDADEAPGPFL